MVKALTAEGVPSCAHPSILSSQVIALSYTLALQCLLTQGPEIWSFRCTAFFKSSIQIITGKHIIQGKCGFLPEAFTRSLGAWRGLHDHTALGFCSATGVQFLPCKSSNMMKS